MPTIPKTRLERKHQARQAIKQRVKQGVNNRKISC